MGASSTYHWAKLEQRTMILSWILSSHGFLRRSSYGPPRSPSSLVGYRFTRVDVHLSANSLRDCKGSLEKGEEGSYCASKFCRDSAIIIIVVVVVVLTLFHTTSPPGSNLPPLSTCTHGTYCIFHLLPLLSSPLPVPIPVIEVLN